MKRPTLDEVTAYCRERANSVDPERFLSYYQSNGWKVGRNPMKDWKAAVRTWERIAGGKKSGPCQLHPDSGLTDKGNCWACYNGRV